MKLSAYRFITFLVFLFLFSISQAQDFQGTAYYMSKTEVDMDNFGRPNMSEDQKKRIAERLKNMFEKTYVLNFNKVESVFKVEEQLEAPGQNQRGGRFGAIMSGAIDGVKYKNIQTRKSTSEHELFGKLFLIKDDLPQLDWKMTGETKQIGNYTCFKATAIKTWKNFDLSSLRRPPNPDDSNADKSEEVEEKETIEKEVVAWYTMQIPVNQGPSEYWGLPGLILEVSTDKTTILCSKIVLNPEKKFIIKEPSKGKEVTKAEYVDIATKKYTEMRENFRRGNGRPRG